MKREQADQVSEGERLVRLVRTICARSSWRWCITDHDLDGTNPPTITVTDGLTGYIYTLVGKVEIAAWCDSRNAMLVREGR